MKKLLILATLLANVANATERYQPSVGATALSQSGALATTGNVGVNNGFKFEDKLQLPNVPNLSAGSSNTTASDYKFKQRQISSLLGGFTNIDMELDIIGFLKYYGAISDVETKKTFNLAACIESEKWRQLRKQQGLDCPKDK